MTPRRLVYLIGLLAVAGIVGWWLSPGNESATQAGSIGGAVNRPQSNVTTQLPGTTDAEQVPPAVQAPLPRDDRVADIDVDGLVQVDINGNLVLDQQLRNFLDFYIGLTGGPSRYEALKARIGAELQAQGLPAAIQAEVLTILDNYLAYQEAAEMYAGMQHSSVEDLRKVLQDLRDLRRKHLGPDVAEGFFGEEELRLQVLLDRQVILHDSHLSAQERQRALAQLDQLLPDYSVKYRQQSQTVVETSKQVQALREQGASEAEVHQLRLRAYGPEATGRLARLDHERDQWQARVAQYRQEKNALENNPGLASEDRQAALEDLRQRMFSEEHERRRIRALDRSPGGGS